MAFDPSTLLTIVLFLSVSLGCVLVRTSFAEPDGTALRGWGFGLLLLGFGTALTLLTPGTDPSPARFLGLALLMMGHAMFWGSARSFTGRPVLAGVMLAGPLLWCAILPFGLAPPWRILVSSCIRAAYAVGVAVELRDVRPGAFASQRWTALLFAAHGLFMAVRAVLGGPVQLLWPTPSLTHTVMAMTGIETILFTGVFGAMAVLLSREMVLDAHRRAAQEDALTGIGNRRALALAWDRMTAGGTGRATSLLLMDLDGFKAVNDRHGHDAGDRLLAAFAALVRERMPCWGQVFRVGGEEFVVLLQPPDGRPAAAVAEDLRLAFSRISVDGPQGPIRTTVSVGVAHALGKDEDVSALIRRADRNLYLAKAGGRDRVVDQADAAAGGAVPT